MAVILASQSPRRRELLERMGISDFLIRPAQGEEIFDPSLTPAQLVEALSRQKAEEISAGAGPEDIVIAADTVVSVDGRVLGKPGDEAEAAEMLAALSGREHTVYTGVTVRRGGETVTEYEVNFSIIDFNTGTVIYEGPTENVISDGVFQESVYRSAPYFDLRIDGITELNS